MIPEREREALMRLTMCAREECGICQYEETCNFDFQYELATKNMNILADALRAEQTEPQTDCDDRYALRNDSGEVVAYACPLSCEQTDCAWK